VDPLHQQQDYQAVYPVLLASQPTLQVQIRPENALLVGVIQLIAAMMMMLAMMMTIP
jgi:hypothetical protein